MFKKVIVCATGLMMLAGSAHASDSVDLKITAEVQTGSCTPSLSDGGEAKFGHIPVGNLNKTDANQLGSRFLTLTISCNEATPVGWSVTDNKKDSVQQLEIKNPKYNNENLTDVNYEYGLGKTSAGVKIGAYAIYSDINNIMADGNKAKAMFRPGSSGWIASGAGEIRNDSTYVYAVEAWEATNGVVLSAQTYVWPLKITAAVQGTDTLNISDDTLLDGSATLSLVYL